MVVEDISGVCRKDKRAELEVAQKKILRFFWSDEDRMDYECAHQKDSSC